jgi:hypothetical protein
MQSESALSCSAGVAAEPDVAPRCGCSRTHSTPTLLVGTALSHRVLEPHLVTELDSGLSCRC